MIPIGALAIITALGIKVATGSATVGTIAAGTTSTGGTETGTTAGISTVTKVALGAGALGAAGGLAALAGGSDGGESAQDNLFTGTFHADWVSTGGTRFIETFELRQNGTLVEGGTFFHSLSPIVIIVLRVVLLL